MFLLLKTSYKEKMKKDWIYKSPEEVGIEASKLNEIEDALKFQMGTIKSVLVIKDGYIVYEKNMPGNNENDKHNLSTVTQSIMSALVGIAIDQNLITSVKQTIGELLPEAKKYPAACQVTVEELLTMSVTFSWKGREPIDRIRRQKNWVEFILSTIARKKKEKFQFSMGCSHLLSAIITNVSGMSTVEFANKYLFEPIGISKVQDGEMGSFSNKDVFGDNTMGWIKDPQGICTGGWGLSLTAKELASFGQLFLDNGVCDGKQIISEKWIKESIEQCYEDLGYSWWLRSAGDSMAYMATGIGGTYLYCFPAYDLEVVIISKLDDMFFDRWELIDGYILPSIK